jgi:ribosomal-protein-alanine N-acetyltransferase
MNDLDQIMDVMDAAFDPAWGEAWSRRQVGESLVFSHTHYRLIGPDGTEPGEHAAAVGFTLVRAAPGEEELLLVGVAPAYRGQGLGKTLIEHALADAQARGAERMFLEMRCNNPAERLYRAMGFEPIGRRAKYYRLASGERIDAITFARRVEASGADD